MGGVNENNKELATGKRWGSGKNSFQGKRTQKARALFYFSPGDAPAPCIINCTFKLSSIGLVLDRGVDGADEVDRRIGEWVDDRSLRG